MIKNKRCRSALLLVFLLSVTKLQADSYLVLKNEYAENEGIVSVLKRFEWKEIERSRVWTVYQSNLISSKFFAVGFIEDEDLSDCIVYDLTDANARVTEWDAAFEQNYEDVSREKDFTFILEWEGNINVSDLDKFFDTFGYRNFFVLSDHLRMINFCNDLSQLNLPSLRSPVIDFELPPIKGIVSQNEFGLEDNRNGPSI